jgi:hypothetical protein
MNERIKELYDVAVEYTEAQDDGTRNQLQMNHVCANKFAELIVRKCAKLNKKQSYELLGVIADTEENDGFDDICLDTVKRVAEYLGSDTLIDHFGVK